MTIQEHVNKQTTTNCHLGLKQLIEFFITDTTTETNPEKPL